MDRSVYSIKLEGFDHRNDVGGGSDGQTDKARRSKKLLQPQPLLSLGEMARWVSMVGSAHLNLSILTDNCAQVVGGGIIGLVVVCRAAIEAFDEFVYVTHMEKGVNNGRMEGKREQWLFLTRFMMINELSVVVIVDSVPIPIERKMIFDFPSREALIVRLVYKPIVYLQTPRSKATEYVSQVEWPPPRLFEPLRRCCSSRQQR